MTTRDMPDPPAPHQDIKTRPQGICPMFMDNITDCYCNSSELDSVKQALYLCNKHFEQCSIYRKHRSLQGISE
jgi:hypothetical protein